MKPVNERKLMVQAKVDDLSIVKQCDLLEISRSGFYHQPVEETPENLGDHAYHG